MLKKTAKGIAIAVSAALLAASFTACTKSGTPNNSSSASATTTSSGSSVVQYPIQTNVTLKYWMELPSAAAQQVKNFGETEIGKTLQKNTGIKVEYQHPSSGSTDEAFNLMIASGDLPDIIEYKWLKFPGGPNSAITGGSIMKLNDVIEKYSPNFKNLLKAKPFIDKMIKTDEGNYYVYPFLRGDSEEANELCFTSGYMLRKDWLDELNLKVPETIDEWYNVLTTLKAKKNVESPLSMALPDLGYFSSGFDVAGGFYVDNGKVKFGKIEPATKDYLATMNKWYKEGLIDKNFATIDSKTIQSNILNGKSAATYGAGGSGIGTFITTMKDKDPNYNLIAAPFPAAKKGTNPKFGSYSAIYSTSGGNAAISASSKNAEIAARFLDYGYSKEGSLLYNFGIENVSYKMVNGVPTYTDLIMKNPQKLSISNAMAMYIRGSGVGPFVQDKGYLQQYYELPQQKDALKVWSKCDAPKYSMPPVIATPEESSEQSKIMADINTYINEMTLKFIMGVEPIDNFSKYVDQIKKLGIDRAIQINQQALDRYNKR